MAGLSRRFFPRVADHADPADVKRVIIAPLKSG
jgi:hypothetical protein